MTRIDLTGALMFGTIGIVLVILIILLARFLRKPQNRHPMDGERERTIDEIRDEATPDRGSRPIK